MWRRPAILATISIVALGLVGAAVAGRGLLGPRSPTQALDPPTFVDEGAASGIDHTYDGPFEHAFGGGIAVLDCDANGRPDLYIAGGEGPATLFRNVSQIGGALHFERVADQASGLAAVNGAYPLDLDADGWPDLVLLRNGQNVLLRGLGDCRFEPANEAWGYEGGDAYSQAFSATWEAGFEMPTLAFGNYVDPDRTDVRRLCDDNELVRPAGSRYAAPIPLAPSWCPLSMLFSDWDRSGRRDLRISNDRHYYRPEDGMEQLWRIEPGAPPRLYGIDDGWIPMQLEGMGIASHDLTGDGYPEVYLTNQGPNRLLTLTLGPEQPAYRDIGLRSGVNAEAPFTGGDERPSTGWHPEFVDVNADGFVDLFVTKGNVDAEADNAHRDPNNLLLGQPDGTFVEAADRSGIVSFTRSRGAAVADLNLDGLPDLVVVNYGDPVEVWRNVGLGDAAAPAPMGNWLGLRLGQPGSNRDGVGAWVEMRIGEHVMLREVVVGGGHAGGQLGWLHFGLGPAARATVTVRWPDGATDGPLDVPANGYAIVERGASAVTPWLAPTGE